MKTARIFKAMIFSVATLVAASSYAQVQFNDAVLRTGFDDDFGTPNLFHDAGYRNEQADLRASFVLGPLAKKIFAQHAGLRGRLPMNTPEGFRPLVQDISNFITNQEKIRHTSHEQKNGISNWALSVKIVRLAFCFDTDPRGIAAQIQVESSFDRTQISPTGAVGFTQMTSAAIDEVNDQLGNRGVTGAREENYPLWYSAIRCYTGGRPFAPMFFDRTIPRGKLVSDTGRMTAAERKEKNYLRAVAKRWLRSNVDRDLIYGQITLKTLLAFTYSKGLRGEAAYREAFRRYNGEPGGAARDYSREVFATMKGSST